MMFMCLCEDISEIRFSRPTFFCAGGGGEERKQDAEQFGGATAAERSWNRGSYPPDVVLSPCRHTYTMNALSAHVLLFLLCCVSTTATSTYLIEERAQVCFFRFVEEETKLQAKVGDVLALHTAFLVRSVTRYPRPNLWKYYLLTSLFRCFGQIQVFVFKGGNLDIGFSVSRFRRTPALRLLYCSLPPPCVPEGRRASVCAITEHTAV